MSTNLYKTLAATFAVTMVVITGASCGGGGAAAVVDPGGNNPGSGLAAGKADLSGQLVQSGSARVASAAGDGLSGLPVSLISTLSGQLTGASSTDAAGRFEIKNVPSGGGYLLKVEFTSASDLNGDGTPDQIELYLPLALADQALTNLVQRIGVADSNSDGAPDTVEVATNLTDDKGRHEAGHREHKLREGVTRVDDNGDGSIDRSFDDSDCDGLPDAVSGGSGGGSDDSSRPHERSVYGVIEAISADSITVGGLTFALTGATTFRIDDNRNADRGLFVVGTYVEVEGFNGGSGLVANKVKTEDNSGAGSGGGSIERNVVGTIEAISADSITVRGVTFSLTSATTFRIDDNRNADRGLFTVGVFVEVEGVSSSSGLVATKVKTEDSAPGSGGGGNGGGGIERNVVGTIEAISADSITVRGVTFSLTSATTFRIDDNRNADRGLFTVGMYVEVEGVTTSTGIVATKVKTED